MSISEIVSLRLLKWRLWCNAVLMVSACFLYMPVQADSQQAQTPIYDATLYANKPDLSRFGLQELKVVYVSELWKDWHKGVGHDELPPDVHIQRVAKRHAKNGNNIIVLDVEHWPVAGAAHDIDQNINKYIMLLRKFRLSTPGKRLGYYGVPPIRDYKRAITGRSSQKYLEWQAENDRLVTLANEVDILFPSLYTFYPDAEKWVKYAQEQIYQARRFGKPVYVFLWPQYHSSNKLRGKHYIDGAFWRLQLETVGQLADGIVIWGGWKDGRPAEWDPDASWWRETVDYIRTTHN